MTVGIVGLGLIGGSFAKAYHAAGWRVLGYDRDESVLSFTQLADAVDEPLTMDNIGTCELVLLCVRPLAAVEYLRQAAPHIGGKPVVIDCCGTKRVVCAAAFPLAKEYGFTLKNTITICRIWSSPLRIRSSICSRPATASALPQPL